MSWWENLLRRARIRGVAEGAVQRARVETLENEARDDAERWQDYGFAAQPVDGQGLVINAGGHTIVLRLDRIAERPQLADYEVTVWHRDGHRLTLKAGGLIEADCTELHCTGKITAPVIEAASSLKVGGKELNGHQHSFGTGPGGNTGGNL